MLGIVDSWPYPRLCLLSLSQVDQNHGVQRSRSCGLGHSITLPPGQQSYQGCLFFSPLVPYLHGSEATLGDGRSDFRLVYVRPSLLRSMGPEWDGRLSSGLGVGASRSNLLLTKKILWFPERSSVDSAPCRTGTLWGKTLALSLPYWTPRVAVSVSVHTVIAATRSFDLGRILAIYTIPPINSSQNYVPPSGDSPDDIKCQCDSVVYRYASA